MGIQIQFASDSNLGDLERINERAEEFESKTRDLETQVREMETKVRETEAITIKEY